MVKSLDTKRYEDFTTMITFEARRVFNARYPDNRCLEWLESNFRKDSISLALLEDISKRRTLWKNSATKYAKKNLLSFILSLYLAIKEREVYVNALSLHAGIDVLMYALKNTGEDLPEPIRDRIKELAGDKGSDQVNYLISKDKGLKKTSFGALEPPF